MIKEIGRLDAQETMKVEDYIEEVFVLFDEGKDKKAIDKLEELCKTNNYYIRELVGKLLTKYKDQEKMTNIAGEMLKDKIYGIRATGLFYFFNKYHNNPKKIISLLEATYDSVPWEVENIIYELWKKNPRVTKEMAPKWVNSEDENKRMISFHGLELIAEQDPIFVLDFIGRAIDDESNEVQKKITHIILQMVRTKPAETYAYLREWIMTGSDKRAKTLLILMKKIVSLYAQKNLKDKSAEFMTLTKQVINDWKTEPNKKIANVGNKMLQTLRKETGKR